LEYDKKMDENIDENDEELMMVFQVILE